MAKKANITIEQGTTFSLPLTLLNANGEAIITTGYTANAQMRKYYDSNNSISFGVALSNGSLVISLDAVASANIVAGRYMYDIVLTDTTANTVTRRQEGIATVTPRVTR